MWGSEMSSARRTVVVGQHVQLGAVAILVALVGFSTYASVLGHFFTGTDTLTLIDTSRIQSYKDAWKILLEPLMAESRFAALASFYRPVSSFSYSLDYWLWGLEPFGYHLTDLLLHALVVGLVVAMLWSVTDKNLVTSAAGGLIFATHPSLVESVTATAMRQDVLTEAFLLLSLLLFAAGDRMRGGVRGFGLLSVLCYVFALGSKEIAIFFPCLIATHALLFAEDMPRAARLALSAKRCMPYLVVTLLFLVWRAHILGGLGGYHDDLPGSSAILATARDITILYGADLVYPNDLLRASSFEQKTVFVLWLGSVFALGVYLCHRTGGGFCSCGARKLKKTVAFLAIWTLLPLAVCVTTLTFNHRSMYNAAIPFCALLACTLVNSLRGAFPRAQAVRGMESPHNGVRSPASRRVSLCSACLSLALAVSLIAYSPLIRRYGEVEDGARVSRALFTRLAAIVPTLPFDTMMHMHGVPREILSYKTAMPRAKEVGYLNDYSIKSWLNLHFPGNRIDVVVESRTVLAAPPDDLEVLVGAADDGNTRLFVYAMTSGKSHSPAVHKNVGQAF
jgi:hypothetical protein